MCPFRMRYFLRSVIVRSLRREITNEPLPRPWNLSGPVCASRGSRIHCPQSPPPGERTAPVAFLRRVSFAALVSREIRGMYRTLKRTNPIERKASTWILPLMTSFCRGSFDEGLATSSNESIDFRKVSRVWSGGHHPKLQFIMSYPAD